MFVYKNSIFDIKSDVGNYCPRVSFAMVKGGFISKFPNAIKNRFNEK